MGDNNKYVREHLTEILRMYRVPPKAIKDIREALLYDSIQEANNFRYDRIYSCIALAIHNVYGFKHLRIFKVLREFDRLCGVITDGANDYLWDDLMHELNTKTGIAIRTDEENRLLLEYEGFGDDHKNAYKLTKRYYLGERDGTGKLITMYIFECKSNFDIFRKQAKNNKRFFIATKEDVKGAEQVFTMDFVEKGDE